MVSKAFLFGMLVVLFTIVAVSEVQACEKLAGSFRTAKVCEAECKRFCRKFGCAPAPYKMCLGKRCRCAPKNAI
ncbi:unnamed protein product [Callosobruchus maculatus]|uniref:Invertebrate defensins family profile domain-containing protein n=1 Tax=Callosobruchus maculatus TaxID=64391 RepID=A0A653DFZ8_CALMS|nr:unnamed protein product [Callosobruchus maculatus]